MVTNGNSFIHSSTTIPKTYTANTFTALNTFGNASTTLFTVTGNAWLGTTTMTNLAVTNTNASNIAGLLNVNGTTGTSTFASNVNIQGQLQIGTGSIYLTDSATSTFSKGISLASGCFSVGGVCVGGGGGIVNAGSQGWFPYYAGAGTTLTATSSIFINPRGYVGIGTTTPQTALHIGTASSTSILSPDNSLMISGDLEVVGDSYLGGSIEFSANSGAVSWIDMPITSASPLGTINSYTAKIDDNDVLTIFAKSDGTGGVTDIAVGIGTTSPYAKLSVVGQVVASYFTATSTIASTFLNSSSTFGTVTTLWSTLANVITGIFTNATTTNLAVTGLAAPAGSFLAVNGDGSVIATTTPALVAYTNANANSFIHSSTTIPKTYTANSFTELNTFGNASTTLFTVTGNAWLGTTTMTNLTVSNTGTGTSTFASNVNVQGQLQIGTGSIYLRDTATSTFSTNGLTVGTNAFVIQQTSGNIGIGTTSPWRTLSVAGTVGFDGLTAGAGAGALCLSASKEVTYSAGATCTVSSERYKNNIESLQISGLSLVNALRSVSFNLKSDGNAHVGLIAEEVGKLDERLIFKNNEGLIEGVRYEEFTSILAKAIQELSASTTEIQTKLDALIASSTILGSLASKSEIWTVDSNTGAIKIVSAGILDLQSKDIINVGKMLSSSGRWSIDENGLITVEKISTKEICFDDVCFGKDQMKTLLQNAGILSDPSSSAETNNSTPAIIDDTSTSTTTDNLDAVDTGSLGLPAGEAEDTEAPVNVTAPDVVTDTSTDTPTPTEEPPLDSGSIPIE